MIPETPRTPHNLAVFWPNGCDAAAHQAVDALQTFLRAIVLIPGVTITTAITVRVYPESDETAPRP